MLHVYIPVCIDKYTYIDYIYVYIICIYIYIHTWDSGCPRKKSLPQQNGQVPILINVGHLLILVYLNPSVLSFNEHIDETGVENNQPSCQIIILSHPSLTS